MSPVLVLFKGHPGVGKSTLARAVCRQLGWPLIDKDDARDCLQQLPADVEANQLSYDIMFSYASTQLQLGLSTVLDCPFARVCLYDRAQALARQHGAVVAVVECIASDAAAWRQQLETRAAQQQAAQAHKPQTWEDLQQLLRGYGDSYKWTTDGSCVLQHLVVVDTTAAGSALQDQVQQVMEFLLALQQARVEALAGINTAARVLA